MIEYIKIQYEALDISEALQKQDYYSDVFEKNNSKFRTRILIHEEIYLVEFLVKKQNNPDVSLD